MVDSLPTKPATAADLEGRQRRWRVAPASSRSATAALGDVDPLVAHLLVRRGITTANEARAFLDVADSLFEDPATLPDVARAIARIRQARDRGETTAVYGDFDA